MDRKQAGTGPSRRHIQGSKIAKGLPRVNLQYSKIEKAKKWTEWRAASASPWRAERGTLPKLSTFLSQLKGGPFGEKNKFSKKKSQCRKLKGGTLWDFPTSILTQNSKEIEGGTRWGFFFPKSLAVPKKIERGDHLVSPGMVCYVEKQEKPFWFSSLGQMVQ